MYSGSMVIFIALFYILTTVGSLMTVPLKVPDWIGIKMIVLCILYGIAAVSFFRKKNLGWVLAAAILLTDLVITIVYPLKFSQHSDFNRLALTALALSVLLVLTFLSLFRKSTRTKYAVNNKSYLSAISVYILVMVATFVL
jgi:hypothetical protein